MPTTVYCGTLYAEDRSIFSLCLLSRSLAGATTFSPKPKLITWTTQVCTPRHQHQHTEQLATVQDYELPPLLQV